MIRVEVRVLGALAKPRGERFSLELPDGSSLEDLLLKAGYRPEHLKHIAGAVNGVQRRPNHPLAQGDEVDLLMPAGGG